MDGWAFGLGAASLVAVPLAYVVIYFRRRRTRALTRHDTTPPTPTVTTGQRR